MLTEILKKQDRAVWTGFIWLRIWASGGLLLVILNLRVTEKVGKLCN
jgi:hypothetical protein